MVRIDTMANRKRQAETHRRLASETGFCLFNDNAEGITYRLLSEIGSHLSEAESALNRLYRGREAVYVNRATATQQIARLEFMARTYREILAAQEPSEVIQMQAAE